MKKFITSISNLFFLAVIAVLAIWLFMEKCGKDKPTVTEKVNAGFNILDEQKRIRDSAYNAQVKKDKQHKADSARWKKTNDSASVALSVAKKKLNESQATVTELANEVDAAYENKDSSRFIIKSLQLADSVRTLNVRVDDYEIRVDNLTRAKDSLQAVTQKRLEENQKLVAEMRNSQIKSDSTIESLKVDIKKAAKKADKKYTVGLGVSAGLTTMGTPGGGAGITISRTIFGF